LQERQEAALIALTLVQGSEQDATIMWSFFVTLGGLERGQAGPDLAIEEE
jgi:hypothetical protein